MQEYQYMQLPLSIIPQEIIDQYQLHNVQHKDIVYMKTRKGMPGIKQAEKVANDCL